jgi:hypothetical protein
MLAGRDVTAEEISSADNRWFATKLAANKNSIAAPLAANKKTAVRLLAFIPLMFCSLMFSVGRTRTCSCRVQCRARQDADRSLSHYSAPPFILTPRPWMSLRFCDDQRDSWRCFTGGRSWDDIQGCVPCLPMEIYRNDQLIRTISRCPHWSLGFGPWSFASDPPICLPEIFLIIPILTDRAATKLTFFVPVCENQPKMRRGFREKFLMQVDESGTLWVPNHVFLCNNCSKIEQQKRAGELELPLQVLQLALLI